MDIQFDLYSVCTIKRIGSLEGLRSRKRDRHRVAFHTRNEYNEITFIFAHGRRCSIRFDRVALLLDQDADMTFSKRILQISIPRLECKFAQIVRIVKSFIQVIAANIVDAKSVPKIKITF